MDTSCDHCGAAFTRPTAKFCSKCGTKKKTVPKEVAKKGNDRERNSFDAGTEPPVGSARATATFKPNTQLPQSNPTNRSGSKSGGAAGLRLPKIDAHPQQTATRNKSDITTKEDTTLEEDGGTLYPTSEDEEKYSAWETLGPEGLTPEMLQTSNASQLSTWRRGLLIGRGTYGSVYLGLLDSGAFYAVKCVEVGKKTGVFSAKELVSLSREINMMQRLHHKNICTFKGVYYDTDTTSICMFMEYIGGGSLSSLVKNFKPLPPSVVQRWTKQLLSGLLCLHSQRIIHRDIKGDNILVDTSSNPEDGAQIKLVDFGAARRLSDAVSQSRTVIGTPYWMAPEIVDVTGEGEGYSYKADVWSVGCTVAEMLTGKPPWPSRVNAPSAIMMIAQATDGPTEIPEAEATPGCLDFMRKCFVRDPEQRPTVEDLMQHPWILGTMD